MPENEPDDVVNILIVDDDQIDVRAVTRGLRQAGIDNPISVAGNGLEGLAVLRGEARGERPRFPYLVLLDLNMPRMNGFEFLEALRADEELRDTVVFVLTTSDDDRDKVAAYEHNVAGYLLKTRAGDAFIDVITMLRSFVLTVRFHRKDDVDAA